MIEDPSGDRRAPITPQLAFRVAILGGIALVFFAIIFFRLWYLQVLSGDTYQARASNNQVRDVVVQAPRGQIVDRNGTTLVDNRLATAVTVEPPRLPGRPGSPERLRLYGRLARVLGASTRPDRCRVGPAVRRLIPLACEVERGINQLPYADVTVKPDASRDEINYVLENQDRFPGVTIRQVYLRTYPFRDVGAQLFGTIGQITRRELGEQRFAGVPQGTVVGQSGLEYSYDRYLRGRDGAIRIQVDSLGQPKRYLRRRAPTQGRTLRLSLDLGLMKAGQQALQTGIGLGAANGANAGAYVAMDPRNGRILAMGSAPSFDPNVFARPITQRSYEAQFGRQSNYPQLDRATQSAYPTGSTFKMITATAGLQSGTISPGTVVDDPGSIKIGDIVFKNAGGAANGAVDMPRAIQVSSDVYFYSLGAQLNSPRPRGGALQRWARLYGFGRPTGIDLPGEASGNVPSPAWRARRNAEERRCERRRHVPKCYIADGRPWSVGDNVNMAVGQGDLQATPLQLATAYAAMADGGVVRKPHIGLDITDTAGQVLQSIDAGSGRRVPLSQSTRAPIMEGLRLAAGSPGGTSADVFAGFPKPVYGKTGTAERGAQPDQSWYVCYVPDPVKPIVVAVTIERGGFGAEAAAPTARLILSQWFGVAKKVVTGSSRTR